MKHHFANFLDGENGYWEMVPNGDRHQFDIDSIHTKKHETKIVTYGKNNTNWEKVFSFPNLEEVTLHEPNKDQLQSIEKLASLKRLRITHARVKDIEFLSHLERLEELVLEYVSGFSDLFPLGKLQKLRSLNLENLRGVSDYKGLTGLKKLKYLRIDGTLDWNQPIDNFEFLGDLTSLEVLKLGSIFNKSPFPALLSIAKLKRMKKIWIPSNILDVKEFAFIEACFPKVKGAIRAPFSKIAYSTIFLPKTDARSSLSDDDIQKHHPEVTIDYKGRRTIADPDSEWFEFLGKRAGRVKCNSPQSSEKCFEYAVKYDSMKKEALSLLKKAH
ncbi:leucine-rich repeat domain-containing protein [Leptospira koniambonensis]|uniref:Leucine-rich repeat domain-containing protein n=1 Tax=Leptospira koniambonensis TaxID=2484950 RepID=A0A4R9J331_9LEPT|nr:leucine-rich repeat domain-containing protein [Leptospira koniambonensis]TGL31296.1 leucine-rich repeat domain-containing protein [Leptospira koniambonensis]